MFYRACTAAPADMCSTLSVTGSSKQATWKVRLMTAQQVLQDFDLKKTWMAVCRLCHSQLAFNHLCRVNTNAKFMGNINIVA